MKNRKLLSALTVAVLMVPVAAGAAVTQLIHFDDADNGWKWYSDKDNNFLFNPTNLDSSTLCADSTNGGNGSCVLEGGQTSLPKMTRPQFGPNVNGVPSQGSASPNNPPEVSGVDQLFTLDSFYFLLTGKGEGADNAIIVTGSNSLTYTFQLGSNYDAPGAPDITFYEGANAGSPAGDLVKNTGYVVTFGDLFKDVTYIQFSAAADAQVRLDCVVATFNGTTTEPASGFTRGCGSGSSTTSSNTVAEPNSSSLAVLALGLLAAGFWTRRKV
jgi:hypothetical protein